MLLALAHVIGGFAVVMMAIAASDVAIHALLWGRKAAHKARHCGWCRIAAFACTELASRLVLRGCDDSWSLAWSLVYAAFRTLFGYVHHRDDDDDRRKKERKEPKSEVKPLMAPVLTRLSHRKT